MSSKSVQSIQVQLGILNKFKIEHENGYQRVKPFFEEGSSNWPIKGIYPKNIHNRCFIKFNSYLKRKIDS